MQTDKKAKVQPLNVTVRVELASLLSNISFIGQATYFPTNLLLNEQLQNMAYKSANF